VHFVIDSVRADKLREKWIRADRGIPLDFIDVSDRRLTRAAAELVEREAADPSTHVTVVLPRRTYSTLLGRLLHDRTADKIAAVVSRIPRSAATIVPYDVTSRVRVLQARQAAAKAAAANGDASAGQKVTARETDVAARHGAPAGAPGPETTAEPPGSVRGQVKGQEPGTSESRRAAKPGKTVRPRTSKPGAPDGQPTSTPAAPDGQGTSKSGAPDGQRTPKWRPDHSESGTPASVTPIGSLDTPGRAVVEGRIRVVEIKPVERNSVLACEISDNTGALTALFYGRSHIPGLVCGSRVRLRGTVGFRADGHPVMINPAYELLFPAL